jgi:predicted DNA-binding protein (MmcQ/YjbR family)
MVTIEDIRNICLSLNGVTEDIKWGNHLCFNVGDKMFLVTVPDEVPANASFKATDEDFEKLVVKKGFAPARYMARYKWVDLDDIGRLSRKEWELYIRRSYELVASNLPKSLKKKLGIG